MSGPDIPDNPARVGPPEDEHWTDPMDVPGAEDALYIWDTPIAVDFDWPYGALWDDLPTNAGEGEV
jgi:hypothetical protein